MPPDLRKRVLAFYAYLYSSALSVENAQLLRDLPPNLAMSITIAINRRLIAHCPIFRGRSHSCIMHLLQCLQPLVFVPNQVIAREGEKGGAPGPSSPPLSSPLISSPPTSPPILPSPLRSSPPPSRRALLPQPRRVQGVPGVRHGR